MASSPEPRRRGRPSLVRKAAELAAREHLFPAGTRALVMVSGGQDSLAMLHMLGTGSLRQAGPAFLHAVHINHHLRGLESDGDEALVVDVCARMGVGLTVVHRPVEKKGGNVQESARNARREAALEVAAERECGRIALGHTADDQVETMLYRLGRYGGLASFAAMAPCDPPWVRPLIECRRSETAAYCHEQQLVYSQDRGNVNPGYARTAIRESVIPAWEAGLPGAVDAACRAAEVAAELQDLTEDVLAVASLQFTGVAGRADGIGSGVDGAADLSAVGLLSLTPAVRRLLLHRWLEEHASPSTSRASVLAVEALLTIQGSAERALGGGWRVRKEYDRVFLEQGRRPPRGKLEEVSLPVPGEVQWGDVTVRAERTDRFAAPRGPDEVYLDSRLVDRPLAVRGFRPGDRLRPFGSPGTRKLQDVLVDLRIPADERLHWPLVVCGERIVWVCGLVLAEEGRITRDTRAFVRLNVSRRSQSGGGGAGRGTRGGQR